MIKKKPYITIHLLNSAGHQKLNIQRQTKTLYQLYIDDRKSKISSSSWQKVLFKYLQLNNHLLSNKTLGEINRVDYFNSYIISNLKLQLSHLTPLTVFD